MERVTNSREEILSTESLPNETSHPRKGELTNMHQRKCAHLKTWSPRQLLSTLIALLTALMYPLTGFAHMSRIFIIEESVWTLSPALPVRKQQVTFYHDRRAAEDPCLRRKSRNILQMYSSESSPNFLRIGEACDHLFVLYRNDEFSEKFGQIGLDFVAHHESFHLLGQIYRNKVPVEMLVGVRPTISHKARLFLVDLKSVLGRRDGEMNVSFRDSYEQLPETDRAGIAFLAGMEWPAEYYAFKVMEARGSFGWLKQYRDIRSALGDEIEYSTGVAVGEVLDKIFDGRSWQTEVNNGATMLDVLLRMTDKDYQQPNRLLVRTERLELNIDQAP